MVGFYGIGGIGKTTLAKALYNKIANDFEGCCFLANVREASNQYRGLVELQKELLREILMDDLIKFSNLDVGISIIRDRLCSKKILLILDDVDTSEQLEALVGEHDSFGPGSMVIVTTRNKHVLVIHEFDILQSVQGLKDDEALKLFSWHAFKQSCPSSDYLDLSKRAVRYCDGLPLALEVVGEDINEVKTKLEACGCLCLEKGTTKLMNLSLLTIDEHSNRIEMHDLIQQMGRTIHLLETSTSHKRKRLLIKDDVMDVLSGNKEARGVKVIKLNFPKPTELDIDSRTFEKVRNLVVLDIRNATSSKSTDLQYLPNSLRWIKWPHFPFSSLPSTYTMDNLIQLKLPHSSIKHFGKAFMCGEWSKEIDLRASKFLVEIPDLTTAINLKKLDLEGCINLVKVHESVGSLNKLVEFYLSSSIKGFEQFPSRLKLKSLKKFELYNCRIDEWCPQFSKEMNCSLEMLEIYNSTVINQLSPTIGYLSSLTKLYIRNCMELKTLPSTIHRLSNLTSLSVLSSDLSVFPSLNDPSSPSLCPYLTSLMLADCKITNLDFLETMVHVAPSLKELDLSENNFCRLPSCIINFKSLKYIYTIGCKLLEEIPNIPEGVVCMDAGGCVSLARFPNNIHSFISCHDNNVEYERGLSKELILMNCEIPDWYRYKSMNNSITFLLPADHLSWKRKALFVPCFKFEVTNYEDWRFALKCKVFINGIQVWDSQSSLTCFPDWGRSFRGYDESRGGEYMSMIVIDPCLHFHPFGDDNMDNSREIDLNQPCFGINSSGSNLDEFKFEVEPFPELRDVIIKMFGVHIITRE
ncbi:TMV resistance protein N-like [Cucumis melo var. makuwa]|uniref:TMV resistance protein N-like n=1 Tax=Cucumis melo var. makuwa TaxID=1194695 RepID=A0A5A7V910_CUCMM|nr:TMV resistance protein N-like [Cucumis melo var. makuwa]